MSGRGPDRDPQQPLTPPPEEEPTILAELHILKIPADSAGQITSPAKSASRIVTMLRRDGIAAGPEPAVSPAEEAGYSPPSSAPSAPSSERSP
jgi:hypothetical protein